MLAPRRSCPCELYQRVHSLLNMLQSDLERVMKANAILTRRVAQLEDEIPLSERMKMFDLDQETD